MQYRIHVEKTRHDVVLTSIQRCLNVNGVVTNNVCLIGSHCKQAFILEIFLISISKFSQIKKVKRIPLETYVMENFFEVCGWTCPRRNSITEEDEVLVKEGIVKFAITSKRDFGINQKEEFISKLFLISKQ